MEKILILFLSLGTKYISDLAVWSLAYKTWSKLMNFFSSSPLYSKKWTFKVYNSVFLWYLRYSLDDLGSGCHVHLSLWQNGKNVFMASDGSSKYGISTLGKEFMAGVLYHLPSILPFVSPLPSRCLLSIMTHSPKILNFIFLSLQSNVVTLYVMLYILYIYVNQELYNDEGLHKAESRQYLRKVALLCFLTSLLNFIAVTIGCSPTHGVVHTCSGEMKIRRLHCALHRRPELPVV